MLDINIIVNKIILCLQWIIVSNLKLEAFLFIV